MKEYCDWKQDGDDESDTWESSCGIFFSLTEGNPIDNNMHFCCYCGKPLTVTPLTWDPEIEDVVLGQTIFPNE